MFGTRIRVGRAARRRIQGGGPLALGRPSANREAWREIRAKILARARWVCQACGVRTRLEVHHLVKRSQGGSDVDLDHLVALCRPCHAQTDVPYARGRLVITPAGGGRFTIAVVRAPSKWALSQPPTRPVEGVVAPTETASPARQEDATGWPPVGREGGNNE